MTLRAHWSFSSTTTGYVYCDRVVSSSSQTQKIQFCPLLFFLTVSQSRKGGDIPHARMVQYLYAPNHTSPWTRPVWEHWSHSPARKHVGIFCWTDFRFFIHALGQTTGRTLLIHCVSRWQKSIEDVLDCKCLQSGANGPLKVMLHPSTTPGAIGISISWQKNYSSFFFSTVGMFVFMDCLLRRDKEIALKLWFCFVLLSSRVSRAECLSYVVCYVSSTSLLLASSDLFTWPPHHPPDNVVFCVCLFFLFVLSLLLDSVSVFLCLIGSMRASLNDSKSYLI